MSDVAVIGLGYVGLPLCLAFAGGGLSVLGVDIDAAKVDALSRSSSYIGHVPSSAVAAAMAEGRFRATTDFASLGEADAILICVPTPLSSHRTPDLTFVESTARAIGPHLRRGQLVVLESTTYPGTTEEVLRPILDRASGLVAGRDFHLAFSPEREDPGSRTGFADIPKLVGGTTDECRRRAERLYARVVKRVVPVRDCRTAEAAKLLENVFRAVNIALVNELKLVYAAMGIDIWEVIAAASTKPFGFMPFHPGPGLGGHCIPIDPFYLSWKALEFGQRTRLIELAGEINTAMPGYVVGRIGDALNDSGLPLRGARVLLLGLAYKPDVDDDRESPTYEIMNLLEAKGAVVDYNDPHIPEIRPGRSHHALQGRRSVPIGRDHDVVVLCTAHREYGELDFAAIGLPLVDCRNAARRPPDRYYRA
jgi:UDP-N-acetyl-D-glucosamine dehydrogenase